MLRFGTGKGSFEPLEDPVDQYTCKHVTDFLLEIGMSTVLHSGSTLPEADAKAPFGQRRWRLDMLLRQRGKLRSYTVEVLCLMRPDRLILHCSELGEAVRLF